MSQESQLPASVGNTRKGLVTKMAEKFSVDPKKLWDTLKSTAFKQRDGEPPTNEQMTALLIVADQYGLNPFTKEIYAYPDKGNGIVPVVGVDGWSRIINNHPQFDGMEFRFAEESIEMPNAKPCPKWCECIIYRKDRSRPTIVPEYLDEVFRNLNYANPWKTHTKRMLRHKAMIQAARIAFGYAGIYDEDEASRIIENQSQAIIQKSYEFNSDSAALPKSQQQPELMQDLANAKFSNMEDAECVQVEQQPVQQQVSSHAANIYQDDSVQETEFGMVASKDVKMISQMIEFTEDTDAWDTTKSSFKERYSGATLEYALARLNKAFNKAHQEEE